MAGNVFFGIMPSQRALVEAVNKGEAPDPSYGAFAKLRSTHNNYLTLPLIFIMISNHYPMTYSHEYGWVVLSAIIFITGFARHFFNLRHRGEFKPVILILAAFMLIALAGFMAYTKNVVTPSDNTIAIADTEAMAIIQSRCASCHAAVPSQAGFASAPAGVALESLDEVDMHKTKLIEVTQSGYMPLANMTKMTDLERQQVIDWLSQR
jgi:uncharacterized membrane protein